MGDRSLAVIHCEPHIPWQMPFAQKMAEGLKRIGIRSRLTGDRTRHDEGFPVLLGTTCWRDVEATGEYLLVDRCSFNDTDNYVSLVWNAHGKRGDHKVPRDLPYDRWAIHGVPLHPNREGGDKIVLCGQTETYSPDYPSLQDWYSACFDSTHFKPHPHGANPTDLPTVSSLEGAKKVVTLNSSIGAQALIDGYFVVAHDKGSMIYGYGSRKLWCQWVAWTQWHHHEIQEGAPIAHLFG